MLKIVVPGVEAFDESADEIVTVGDVTLELEHSLVSLSKWESEFEKPFLAKGEKTEEEVVGYVKAMTMTPDPPEEVWYRLTNENFDAINRYLDAKMTATTIYEMHEAPQTKKETVTAELIYYWMFSYQIPLECEHWHLNRLFTLIRIFSMKAEKPKKMSQAEIARRNREINARRKAKYKTRG